MKKCWKDWHEIWYRHSWSPLGAHWRVQCQVSLYQNWFDTLRYINYLCFLLVVNVPVPSCCSLLVWEQQMYKFSQDHLSQRKMLFLAVWFEAGRAAVDSARSSVTAEMTLINWNNKKEQGRRWVAKQRAEKTANIGELNHFKKGAKINEKDGIWSADAGWSNMTADVGFPDITQHKAADEAEMSSELDLTACLN